MAVFSFVLYDFVVHRKTMPQEGSKLKGRESRQELKKRQDPAQINIYAMSGEHVIRLFIVKEGSDPNNATRSVPPKSDRSSSRLRRMSPRVDITGPMKV